MFSYTHFFGQETQKMNPDLRFDKFDHWAKIDDKNSRSRCKILGCNSITHVFCTKCNVHICFTRKRNCFFNYHDINAHQKTQVKDATSIRRLRKKTSCKVVTNIQTSMNQTAESKSKREIKIINSTQISNENNQAGKNAPKSNVIVLRAKKRGAKCQLNKNNKSVHLANKRVLRQRVIDLDKTGSIQKINVSSRTVPKIPSSIKSRSLKKLDQSEELKTQYFSYLLLSANTANTL